MLPPRISVLLTCERIAAGSFSLEYRSMKRDKDNFQAVPIFFERGSYNSVAQIDQNLL